MDRFASVIAERKGEAEVVTSLNDQSLSVSFRDQMTAVMRVEVSHSDHRILPAFATT